MIRKSMYLGLTMILMIAYGLGLGFGYENPNAGPILPSEIIIAEPVSSEIVNTKNIFVSVNINNTAISDAPVTISLVQIMQELPFKEQIKDELDVSVMRLNSSSAPNNRSTALNRVYTDAAISYSEGYSEEIELINRFFELKDQISTIQTQLYEINRIHAFDLLIDRTEEVSKMTEDVYNSYMVWLSLKSELNTLKNAYTQVTGNYLSLFEKHLYLGKIQKMSYIDEIGKLANGTYALRFLNDENKLIKEVQFVVIDEEQKAIPLVPYN